MCRSLGQMVFARVVIKDNFDKIDDGQNQKIFNLNNPNQGLLIVPGKWRSLTEFFPESICLVLASELYSEEDYI